LAGVDFAFQRRFSAGIELLYSKAELQGSGDLYVGGLGVGATLKLHFSHPPLSLGGP
jgi:hypothetical protein